MNNKVKYLMIFSILLMIIGIIGFSIDSISFEDKKQKQIEESKEIQKFRLTILDYSDGIATVEGGKQYNVSTNAQKQMILKKSSDVYINTSSNEIVEIRFQEYIR